MSLALHSSETYPILHYYDADHYVATCFAAYSIRAYNSTISLLNAGIVERRRALVNIHSSRRISNSLTGIHTF